MKSIIIIPARWNSKRFPGKPLAKINNKELIFHVWERAILSKQADLCIVATDDKRIKKFCENNDIKVISSDVINNLFSQGLFSLIIELKFGYKK